MKVMPQDRMPGHKRTWDGADVNQKLLLAVIAVSTPAALGLEVLVRRLLLPPDVEEMRLWLNETVGPPSWALLGVALAAIAAALSLQPRLFAHSLAAKRVSMPEHERVERSRMQALLLSTSICQVPALLATVGFTFGADALAVGLTVGLGTLGVLLQWPASRRLGR